MVKEGDVFVVAVKPQVEAELSIEKGDNPAATRIRLQMRDARPIRIGSHEFMGVAADITVEQAVGLCEVLRKAINEARSARV